MIDVFHLEFCHFDRKISPTLKKSPGLVSLGHFTQRYSCLKCQKRPFYSRIRNFDFFFGPDFFVSIKIFFIRFLCVL